MDKTQKLNTPLYKDVVAKIEKDINDGIFPSGCKLPSARKLAKELKVSLFTVYQALEELKYQGIIDSKPQSHYFVSHDGWSALFPNSLKWDDIQKKGLIRKRTQEAPFFQENKQLFLSAFALGEHFRHAETYNKTMNSCAKNIHKFICEFDNDYRGSLIVRKTICEYMKTYGINAEPDEVCITSGVFNALCMIRLALMRAGMSFFCDSNFTTKSNESYSSLGINKIHLPLDGEGICQKSLINAVSKYKSAVVCSLFGTNSPYGDEKTYGLANVAKKIEFLRICNISKIPIIEIDNYRALMPDNAPPPLKSLDNGHSVLYVGSLTKIFPRLRFGWIVATPYIINKFADIRMQIDGNQDFTTQSMAHEFLGKNGAYSDFITKLKEKLPAHVAASKEIMDRHLSPIASINTNNVARTCYVKFNDKIDVRKMYKNRNELDFTPGFALDGQLEQMIPISMLHLSLSELDKRIAILAKLAKLSFRS